jgi:hypothetical protein
VGTITKEFAVNINTTPMNILIQLQAFIEIDILYAVQLASENKFIARYIDKM